MELRIREFQVIQINKSIIRKYSSDRFIHNFQYIEEEPTGTLSLKHLKESSLEAIKKVDEKLRTPPYFLKAKTIRKEIGRELFIKNEYSDKWDTYKNTNRVNLSKFVKDMLPYVNKPAVKRLMCGKHFRKSIDSLLINYQLSPIAQGPGSYAVLNPNKKKEFFTEEVMDHFVKEFDEEELIEMTKDEELVWKALDDDSDLKLSKAGKRDIRRRAGGGAAGAVNHRTHMYSRPIML